MADCVARAKTAFARTLVSAFVATLLSLWATLSLAQQTGYIAKILVQIDQVMPPEALQGLSAADRTRIEQQSGAQLIQAEHVLRFPAKPMEGYWLKVGARRYRIDEQGLVHVPSRPRMTQKLKLYAQVGDSSEVAVLPSVTFVSEPKVPDPTIVKVKYTLPSDMNPKQ